VALLRLIGSLKVLPVGSSWSIGMLTTAHSRPASSGLEHVAQVGASSFTESLDAAGVGLVEACDESGAEPDVVAGDASAIVDGVALSVVAARDEASFDVHAVTNKVPAASAASTGVNRGRPDAEGAASEDRWGVRMKSV
jgi:hypothetical protein